MIFKNPKSIPIQSGQNPKTGFTLIELLVVISIIVILITMGLTTFSSAQKKGRDAKRKADLRDIKNAMEQYYTVCGLVYPVPDGNSFENIICWSPVTLGILEPVPTDPRTGNPYTCPDPVEETCNENNYQICTYLEGSFPSDYCITSSQ